MMWGRRGSLQAFSHDLPGGSRRDTPLPRWIGRTDAVKPFPGSYEVTEDFEPLDESEDATDDRQDVTVSLPAAVLAWLEDKAEELDMTVSEVLAVCAELQMPEDPKGQVDSG